MVMILPVSLGLGAIGFFWVLKKKANKGKLDYLHFLVWGHIMCEGLFAVALCGVSIRILEKFFSLWIAGPISVAGSVLLMILVFKLSIRELEKLANQRGGKE